MSDITHYVRVVDGQVTDCWDIPPAEGVGNNGWMNAVEVKPEIVASRQTYTAHTFDVTQDPVQIVYGVVDITVGDRKSAMKSNAKAMFQQMVNRLAMNTDSFDVAAVQTAQTALNAKLLAIEACDTHDQLDALTN